MSWEDGICQEDKGKWTEELFVLAELQIGNPGHFDPRPYYEDELRAKVYDFIRAHGRIGVISFIDCWRAWRLYQKSHSCVT